MTPEIFTWADFAVWILAGASFGGGVFALSLYWRVASAALRDFGDM